MRSRRRRPVRVVRRVGSDHHERGFCAIDKPRQHGNGRVARTVGKMKDRPTVFLADQRGAGCRTVAQRTVGRIGRRCQRNARAAAKYSKLI